MTYHAGMTPAETRHTMTYEIRYASGTRNTHDDYQSAVAEINGQYPDAYLHDCGEGRTLVWADEAEGEDDDGSDAVAEIIEVEE
jgi:hypothetical protein